ncbi:orotidine-5'-phosphate decarboxylase [Methanolacinia paynteri]|uniref:orotidine-5'-phosphate decarboxylase n=1 Tax=Methanolacinia paynteri TaxID=230356 RepID=UPI00064F8134|nr:orotidine-5'-phosphate decarboxylase [Methanolacinia paynteri]
MGRLQKTYTERADHADNPAAKRLLLLMEEKKTNLCVAADDTCANRILELAEALGPDIAVFKTHVDIIEDFDQSFPSRLREIAEKYNFMIFEDRKFADIGNTVRLQYSKGIYRICEWADLVNVHAVPGKGVVEGITEVNRNLDDGIARGILMISQMSSKGTLATGEYTRAAVSMANQYREDCAGHIGAGSDPAMIAELAAISDDGHLIMTPGVSISVDSDGFGQKYATPGDAISAGSDCIIVGRGIYASEDPVSEAGKYRRIAWEAYLKRTGKK